MKLHVLLVVILAVNLIKVSYGNEDGAVASESKRQSWRESVLFKMLEVLNLVKETEEKGQERQKLINYGCIWKICSKPLKNNKPSKYETKKNLSWRTIEMKYKGIIRG